MITGFAPIADERSLVLILGSMPSEASLAKGEYYGHPRNAFWPLMSALLKEPVNSGYPDRVDMLLRHRIALWDVVASCERDGSSDADIHNVSANDFSAFFAAHPAIRHVFFNGGKAYELYKKHSKPEDKGIVCHRLGSTSPAHAISFETRLNDWKCLLNHLREETQHERKTV
jgi:TDG/mug DNA glycosylase family protein